MYTIDGRITGNFKVITQILDEIIGGKMYVSRYKLDKGQTIKIRNFKLWKI